MAKTSWPRTGLTPNKHSGRDAGNPHSAWRRTSIERVRNAVRENLRLLSALISCGMVAPVLFGVLTIAAVTDDPGYDRTTQMLSDLAKHNDPHRALAVFLGFIVPGLLTLGFAWGLYGGLVTEVPRARLGPGLVAIGGAALIGVGVFTTDPGTVIGIPHAFLHYVFTIIVLIASTFAPLAIARWSRRHPDWERFGKFSLAVGVLIGISITLIFIGPLRPVQGLLERTYASLSGFWMAVAALRLLWWIWQGRPVSAKQKTSSAH